MTRVFFTSVEPLPDYRLKVEMETGSSVLFDFSGRLNTARFGSLRDPDVFSSVRTDGTYLIFSSEGRDKVKIGASEFMDLLMVDRTK